MSAAAFGAIARQAGDRPELEDVFRALKQMQRDMDWLACSVVVKRLWVYECRHCAGWHLTSRNQGSRYAVERQGAK